MELEDDVKKSSSALRQIAPYLNLGGVMAGCVAGGALFGYWLDGKFETEPWILLGGSLFGIGAAFYHFFKVVLNPPSISDEPDASDEDHKK